MRHRIDWSGYGEQVIAPDRYVTAVCGEVIVAVEASEDRPTCAFCQPLNPRTALARIAQVNARGGSLYGAKDGSDL